MKKLTKFAALMLTGTMIMPMAVKAEDSEVVSVMPMFAWSESADTLKEYGIFVGDENGDLKQYENITKAEMSKALCSALGLEPDTSGEQIFADVDSSHWAYGYINTMVANKISSGSDNYYFEPDHKVTYGEAVRMIVGALGYGAMLETYPEGYEELAQRLGLTKDTEQLTEDTPCLRYIAFKLFDNALDIPFLIVSGYNGGAAEYVMADGKNGNSYMTMRYGITGEIKE